MFFSINFFNNLAVFGSTAICLNALPSACTPINIGLPLLSNFISFTLIPGISPGLAFPKDAISIKRAVSSAENFFLPTTNSLTPLYIFLIVEAILYNPSSPPLIATSFLPSFFGNPNASPKGCIISKPTKSLSLKAPK